MHYDREKHDALFNQFLQEGKIVGSDQQFKIRLFLEKSKSSLLIAQYCKNPNDEKPSEIHWHYWSITISYYAMLYATKAAILSKGYEVKDHFAAQIALGHLFVPDEMQKEDLILLNQAHKIFETEYVAYFDEARVESNIARYTALKKYTGRRVTDIFKNATKFIQKIDLLLR